MSNRRMVASARCKSDRTGVYSPRMSGISAGDVKKLVEPTSHIETQLWNNRDRLTDRPGMVFSRGGRNHGQAN